MNVFVVVLEDRHTDLQIEVFASQGSALNRATEIVKEYDYAPQEDEKTDYLFFARLSGEGDCVWVEEVPVAE